MKHRDVEFTVIQSLGRRWEWSTWLGHFHLKGKAATKAAAIAEAERAIDRALAPMRLIRPDKD
jgi:DNA segregation ATPase FtsK/SpoIIIE-like protein